MSTRSYDLAVVGGGIVGLAHALTASRLGKRVVLFEREAACTAASIRNFGFVTVTGQERGPQWRRARRTRDIWDTVASRAGIPIEQRGLTLALHSEPARRVAEAFLATEMGAGCELLSPAGANARFPQLRDDRLVGVLYSPYELRVEARDAIPRLTRWLSETMGVDVRTGVAVTDVDPPWITTSAGPVEAGAAIVCPGSDFSGLFPDRLAAYGLNKCKLHMLRARPVPQSFALNTVVMGDLSLVRYPGYAALPESAELEQYLHDHAEMRHALNHGIHLIAVQSADGSLVLGDSHHTGKAPDPFQSAEVDAAILDRARATLCVDGLEVNERWTGVYAAAKSRENLVDRPADRIRIVVITSGTGMSTGFALAEEVVGELFQTNAEMRFA